MSYIVKAKLELSQLGPGMTGKYLHSIKGFYSTFHGETSAMRFDCRRDAFDSAISTGMKEGEFTIIEYNPSHKLLLLL